MSSSTSQNTSASSNVPDILPQEVAIVQWQQIRRFMAFRSGIRLDEATLAGSNYFKNVKLPQRTPWITDTVSNDELRLARDFNESMQTAYKRGLRYMEESNGRQQRRPRLPDDDRKDLSRTQIRGLATRLARQRGLT